MFSFCFVFREDGGGGGGGGGGVCSDRLFKKWINAI